MTANVIGLLFGAGFGFVMAWAQLSDPAVIGKMLRLREFDVFLVMGCAVAVAAVGARLLRGAKAVVTQEPIGWRVDRPQRRHIVGSVLFGVGWSVAGTCPGPVAVMIGQGRLAGLAIVAGVLVGVAAQGALSRRRTVERLPTVVAAVGM